LKGDYEVFKEYHKDPSMRVVPLAVKNYFVYGIPIKKTIYEDNDIFDFCLRLKVNSLSDAMYTCIRDNKVAVDKLDRTTRYYISLGGGNLYKQFKDGRQVGVNIGYTSTIFNTYIEKPIKEYKINYQFYIAQTQKLIDAIDDGQLSLFDF
jgi:hypothetical protein